MGILDKAREITEKVKDKSFGLVSDELLADLIMLAVSKQEKVNEVLQARRSSYRISGIDIEIGVPPKVIFGIRKFPDNEKESQPQANLESDITTAP